MKRRAFQIVVLLVLGAIVNVAVAWGLVYRIKIDWRLNAAQIRSSGWGLLDDDPESQRFRVFTVAKYERFGTERVSVFCSGYHSGIPDRTKISSVEKIPIWARRFLDIPETSSIVDGRGWPCLTLWGGFRTPDLGKASFDGGMAIPLVQREYYMIPIDDMPTSQSTFTDYRWLPLRPIWPGFAINTIFYAAMLWVVFFVPAMVRRRIRRRRGLCPACAYPIGTSPVCTECGKSLA